MKTKIGIIALIVTLFIILPGCGGKQEEVKQPNVPEVVEKVPEVDPDRAEIDDFFNKFVNTSERPIAVMVDNDDKNARPHAGLNEAYLIYEMVVEGGATRFMGVFKGTDTEKIGPVRSSRHYYLDYVMENDAIYTHFGWSPKAITDISAFGINKINGVLGTDEGIFWRERKFKGDWHSAYTSIEKIKNMAQAKGYKIETEHKNGIVYSDKYIELKTGNKAENISLIYSPIYTTGYKYNAEKKVYEKSINNEPHVMQNGDVLEVKNIIIELIYDTDLGDGTARRNINTAGSGEGYYITCGEYEKITWSKASRSANTVYKKADGTELLINPGKTIVNIISPSAGLSIQ